LTIYDAGIFIYPLGLCLFFAVFIFAERLVSLRRSVTFPRKVEKALRMGEFPSKKWKQKSAAERIVWVALHENPSPESLSSYKNLEVSAMERGFFILEVIISASPLIGLLGTVTGLVQVFSSISDINQGKDVLAEGIGLALLTTILGLAIAIPTLIGHSYLGRILDKRIASLNWVTSRINDARQRNPAEIL
jgi:biopolymer transport protein ExbB